MCCKSAFRWMFYSRGPCREIGLPYMLHPAHMTDTLFIFCEADFRFYQRDCLLTSKWLPLVARASELHEAQSSGDRSRSPNKMRPRPVSPEPRDEEAGSSSFGGMTATTRGDPSWESEASPELIEMIQSATLAHRHGVGEIVWYGWSAAPPRQEG